MWYQICTITLSAVVATAVIIQTHFSGRLKKFTEQQIEINRQNQQIAMASAQTALLSEIERRAAEGYKILRGEADELFGEEWTPGREDWLRELRNAFLGDPDEAWADIMDVANRLREVKEEISPTKPDDRSSNESNDT